MKNFHWIAFAFLSACLTAEPSDKDSDNNTSDPTSSENDDTDNQADNNEACSDYRSAYPAGEYGFTVGSILADFPGMVDGNGTTQTLNDIYTDSSKQVLVIANAFDT